ncbi:MAG: methylated-DNA--[protein]-cysteine S-methyltransferase [Polyangiaceae bacterium]
MSTRFSVAIPTPLGDCRATFSLIGLRELWLPHADGDSQSCTLDEPPHQSGSSNDSSQSVVQRRWAAEFARELEEYFAGVRRSFVVQLDLSSRTGFTKRVLERLRSVPYGVVVTYGELARACGNPHGARAVGTAMRNNPIPIVIPCHRVIAAGGKIGGYSPGLSVKRRLFEVEGIRL